MTIIAPVGFRRIAFVAALCAAMVGMAGSAAQARVFIGVGVGVPFFVPGFYPAPYYYPPPVYYAPPPVVYTPPQNYSQGPADPPSGAGQMCYAASYSCPVDRPVASGGTCYCVGNGGQRVYGRAN